jgi:uncharacterized protein (DUF39 family)
MSDFVIKKSYAEINKRIKNGNAVVVTAEEMPKIVADEGVKKAFEKVDVVTTGTFGTMCSSGAFINIGHTKPKIKTSKVWFNDVEAYGGIAAVDCYLGAAQVKEDDPLNMVHPGKFTYGGGHVIEDLIAGKPVRMKAVGYGTDCYPKKLHEETLTINDLRNAFLYNPRNAYQNYNCAVNNTKKTIYTYMGILRPEMSNLNYSTAGTLSPLHNDPYYWTIGVGTKIFLGGAAGMVSWQGTQHDPDGERGENGLPLGGAGTLAVTGDMKQMNSRYIRGASITGYGTSLMVGIGIPIPIINEEIAAFTGIPNKEIMSPVIDYGYDYPNAINKVMGHVSYEDLMKGEVMIGGQKIPTAPMASIPMAREIAQNVKEWVENGFTIGEPQMLFPSVPFNRK